MAVRVHSEQTKRDKTKRHMIFFNGGGMRVVTLFCLRASVYLHFVSWLLGAISVCFMVRLLHRPHSPRCVPALVGKQATAGAVRQTSPTARYYCPHSSFHTWEIYWQSAWAWWLMREKKPNIQQPKKKKKRREKKCRRCVCHVRRSPGWCDINATSQWVDALRDRHLALRPNCDCLIWFSSSCCWWEENKRKKGDIPHRIMRFLAAITLHYSHNDHWLNHLIELFCFVSDDLL